MNYIDIYHRMGYYPQPLPFIRGVEGASLVEAIRQGVTHMKAGDRVAHAGPIGAYAQIRLIAAEAHRALEERSTTGSTILSI